MYYGYGYGLPKAVKTLLIVNAAVFVLSALLGLDTILNALFGLRPILVVKRFMLWQPLTYMFLHADFSHIAFNMFGLWMFGVELEYNWGSRDFLKYYIVCGIGGALLVVVTSLLPFHLSSPFVTTIGASGAIYGILLAYGMMWPDRMILVFFVMPMKALHFVILFGAIDLLQGLTHAGGGVAYFAHVGGLLTGFVYLKYGWRIVIHFENFFKRHNPSAWNRRRNFTVVDGGRGKSDSSHDESPHPDIDGEVDRILDKIARNGMESLTEEERRVLDRASRRK
jgi:membrane associated rhomboid family serine protease